MTTSRFLLSCSALLFGSSFAAGCSDSTDAGASFAFNRPELLELVCLDPGRSPSFNVKALPMRCCADDLALTDPESAYKRNCSDIVLEGDEPVLHALVSQSTRGEVAGVDLTDSIVLDSDDLVPGYNFVDVGGLPRALVAPVERTLTPADTSLGTAPRPMGPPWTYVASAENQQVVAVATCRFRKGTECGPELADEQAQRTVPLPSPPRDMLHGPDDALWVTLPESGALARIELGTHENEPFTSDGPALESYEVPIPVVPGADDDAAQNELEVDSEYVSTCGLGYMYQPVRLTRPLAPRVLGPLPDAPRPTRMRLDASTGLLFVADAALPVLHLFSVPQEGGLVSLGALPTGAPVRDFALTAEVPVAAPTPGMLPDNGLSSEPMSTKRYLYAIDDRDGSLMAFVLTASPDGASLKPLAAPMASRYADRLRGPGAAAVLDVIDTRGLTAEACGEGTDPDLSASIERQLRDKNDAAQGAAKAEANQRLEIAQNAGPRALRGVFVVVVGLNGTVSVIDVLDLDLYCRRAESCEMNGQSDELAGGSVTPVGVQRHATRLSTVAQRNPVVSASDALDPLDCASLSGLEGYVGLEEGENRACVPADPWNQLDQTWSIEQERAVPGLGIPAAAIADEGDAVPGFEELSEGQLVLLAPSGVNLCERGLLANSPPPALDASVESPPDARVEDVIAILSDPPEYLRDQDCASPEQGSEILLNIDEAYADRVVVSVAPESEGRVDAAQLRRCYPDLLDFEVRVGGGDYLVSGTSTSFLHRVTTREIDRRCVVDTGLDPRLRSRARAGELFVNPYIAFQISAEDPPTSLIAQVISGRAELRETVYDPGTSFADALPASVRFFPFTNDLFIVDSASQGLRRFALSPFTRTGQTFR